MASGNGVASVQKIDRSLLAEKGLPGLANYGGQVTDEFLPQLRGKAALRTFTEMSDNDPICGAILFAVDMLVRAVEWRALPAEETPAAEEWAMFLDECVHDMSEGWDTTLSSILSMLRFGFSVHEIVYKERLGENPDDPTRNSRYDDGRIGWRKFAIRGQDTIQRWMFDNTGGIQGIEQAGPPDWKARQIPIEKLLLFRPSSYKNNPEGRSILRNAYRPWYFKKRIENIEGIGIERDLAGIPIGWVPPEWLDLNATEEQKGTLAAIEKIVRNIKRDEQEGIIFPLQLDERGNKLFDLTLLTTGGKRQFNTDAIIGRYDQRIALTVLADFILLGHEKVGSFNLGVTKVDLFSAALGAWLDSISEIINMHAIPRLMRLNGCPPEMYPRLEHADVQRIDLEVLGTFIERLAKAGAPLFPDQGLENHLRLLANLPEQTEEERQQALDALVPAVDPTVAPPDPFLQGAGGMADQ